MAIFSSAGAFGMFCLVSAVCGFLGVGIGRGLILFWDDVHNEASESKSVSQLDSILGCIGALIPTVIAIVSALRSTP